MMPSCAATRRHSAARNHLGMAGTSGASATTSSALPLVKPFNRPACSTTRGQPAARDTAHTPLMNSDTDTFAASASATISRRNATGKSRIWNGALSSIWPPFNRVTYGLTPADAPLPTQGGAA